MGKVRISVESLGDKPLVREFEISELEGKNVKKVLENMVQNRWNGKDMAASDAVAAEMRASKGYSVGMRLGGKDTPVRYEPIALEKKTTELVRGFAEEEQVELVVNGVYTQG